MANVLRWTAEQFQAHLARTKQQTPTERMQALGRQPAGTMNKTEAAYALLLEAEKQAGTIVWYMFEAWRLKLAKRTTYTPDFIVKLADGTFQAHEVKGRWTDDARVKIKVAAVMHPIQFIAIRRIKGEWQREYF